MYIIPESKIIQLEEKSVTAQHIYSYWVDWVATNHDNCKYLPAFRTVGGDDLGSSLSISPYYFLINGWVLKPMSEDHTLTIEGNLFSDDGTDIVVRVGGYDIIVQYKVPVMAQAFCANGTGSGTSTDEILVQLKSIKALIFE